MSNPFFCLNFSFLFFSNTEVTSTVSIFNLIVFRSDFKTLNFTEVFPVNDLI